MLLLRRLFRDPISGLLHLAGAFLGLLGLIYLLNITQAKDATTIAAVTVYGVSMVLLYASSSTYHLIHTRDAMRARLRQVDHAMIPIFIAGSYTPFCLITLQGTIGNVVLIAIWALALGGLLKSIYWVHAPRWITAGLFLLMGWMMVIAVYPLYQTASSAVFSLIVAGGLAYSLGAVIYATKWPDPWPDTFGFHEIWHLCVLAGSAFHYASVVALFA